MRYKTPCHLQWAKNGYDDYYMFLFPSKKKFDVPLSHLNFQFSKTLDIYIFKNFLKIIFCMKMNFRFSWNKGNFRFSRAKLCLCLIFDADYWYTLSYFCLYVHAVPMQYSRAAEMVVLLLRLRTSKLDAYVFAAELWLLGQDARIRVLEVGNFPFALSLLFDHIFLKPCDLPEPQTRILDTQIQQILSFIWIKKSF